MSGLPTIDASAPPTARRSDEIETAKPVSHVYEVHATSGPPNPPSPTRPPRWRRKHRAARRGPESVLHLQTSLAAKAAASRRAWEAFYEKADPEAAAPKPFTTELSAGLARALFTPSMVRALEARFELQPGELTSGAVTVLRMAKRSTQAEATIYDPRRKRHASASVDVLGPEDLAALADALRVLKEWNEPKQGKAKK